LITAKNYDEFKELEDGIFDELAEKIIQTKLESTKRCN